MSVIHDALKTAQREKQDREAGMSPAGMPVIAPRRPVGDEPAFDWKNAATIAVASIVIVGALGTLWVRMQNLNPRAVDNVPVVTVPADISPAAPAVRAPIAVATREPLGSAPAQLVGSTRPVDEEPPQPFAPAPQRADPVAPDRRVPAPRVATGSSDVPEVSPPARPAAQPAQLRIAVEPSRDGDLARLFAAGVAAHRAGDFAEARSAYERVLAAAPKDVDVLNNLGVVLAATRDVERGEVLLRRAVQLAPNHAGAWNNLGAVLAQRGQHADAIAAFQRALAIDPAHQGARVSLAQQHLAIGAAPKARELLESVAAANPSMAEAHYALGQAFEMEKDWAGAVRAYGAFIRVAPPRFAAVVERVQQRVQMLSARVR